MAGVVRIGASANIDTPPTSKDQSFQHLMYGGNSNTTGTGTGPLLIRRTFKPGPPGGSWGPPSSFNNGDWRTDISLHGVEVTWLSFKADPPSLLYNGNYDSDLDSLIASWPDGHEGWITFWHEPEDNLAGDTPGYRRACMYLHWYIRENRGTKNLKVANILQGLTFDEQGRTLSDWIPVYTAAEASRNQIPAGFSIGDPGQDFFAIDFYDRNATWATARREWDPQVGGNPLGLTGYIDKLAAVLGVSRSEVVWATGEIATKRTGAAGEAWWQEIIEKSRDDASTCLGHAWFHNDKTGEAAPWDMPGSIQDWIATNGPRHGADTVPRWTKELELTYDVEEAPPVTDRWTSGLAIAYDVEFEQTLWRRGRDTMINLGSRVVDIAAGPD